MKTEEREAKTAGRLRWTRETERRFFFYATIGMFMLYGATKLFG